MSQIGTASPPLMSWFAAGSRAIDLLPHLHRYAIETTGGGCSLLFEHNPRSGALHPTSGYGLDALRVDPWGPEPEEASLLTHTLPTRTRSGGHRPRRGRDDRHVPHRARAASSAPPRRLTARSARADRRVLGQH